MSAASLVMGVVVGPRTDEAMRRSPVISGGGFQILLQKPICFALVAASALPLVAPPLHRRVRT